MYQIGSSAHLPVDELKELCRTRGLRFGGRKKGVLMARLEESDRAEDERGDGKKRTEQSQCMSFCLCDVCQLTRRDVGQAMPIDVLSDVGQATPIDVLSDEVLLSIFDVYIKGNDLLYGIKKIEKWQTLVHVCRRWRSIVFGSPRSLNLRLACTDDTPVGSLKMLDVWPPLPVVIFAGSRFSTSGLDNIIPALEYNDRICNIMVDHRSSSQLENVVAAMRRPFPALKVLELKLFDEDALVSIPDSFLGGSAPLLQILVLEGAVYPALQKLLLSTTNLSSLLLLDTPQSGYISVEEMVTCLSALTSLKHLRLSFPPPSSESLPHRTSQHSPPPTRVVLPTLTQFSINGFSEYVEDLVARIDTPLVDYFHLFYPDQPAFDTPHVIQYISRTPKLKELDEVQVVLNSNEFQFRLHLPTSTEEDELDMGASYAMSYRQLSSLAQARTSSLFPVSTVKNLYIREDDQATYTLWGGDIEDVRWLLRPFTSVKTLYVSDSLTELFEPALRDGEGERVTDMLPALQDIDHYWR